MYGNPYNMPEKQNTTSHIVSQELVQHHNCLFVCNRLVLGLFCFDHNGQLKLLLKC